MLADALRGEAMEIEPIYIAYSTNPSDANLHTLAPNFGHPVAHIRPFADARPHSAKDDSILLGDRAPSTMESYGVRVTDRKYIEHRGGPPSP